MPATAQKPPPNKDAFKSARDSSTVALAEALELFSRNLARLAVKLRSVIAAEPREEYQSFVETIAVLHDPRALADLRASDLDEELGDVRDWDDVRRDLGLGESHPHADR